MNIIFFHNKYDKNSIELLNTLSPDVQIIDVYGNDEIPNLLRLSYLPYLVDKQIISVTPAIYYSTTPTIQFECRDYQNNLIIDEKNTFYIEIKEITDYGLKNIGLYSVYSSNGIIEIQLDCPVSKTFRIRLDSDGYYPWEGDVEVINDA